MIAESTVLDHDLHCLEDGLVVGAPRIVIDLGGHEIRNVAEEYEAENYTGIRNPGYEGVRILNGAIRVFGQGVFLGDGSHGSRIRDLEIFALDDAGVFVTGSDRVQLSFLTIQSYHDGIRIESAIQTGIFGVEVNGANGLILHRSRGSRVRSSAIWGEIGILLDSSPGNWLVENHIGGGNAPIRLSFSSGNRIWRNRLLHTDINAGIYLDDSHDNWIAGNEIDAGSGIQLRQSDRNRIVRNLVRHTHDWPGALVVFSGLANRIAWNRVMPRFVAGCRYDPFQYDGIHIEVTAQGTMVLRNFVTNSDDDGIEVADVTATLSGNRADSNCDLGIVAHDADVDGGGNAASDNGNPAQCVNVDCSPR